VAAAVAVAPAEAPGVPAVAEAAAEDDAVGEAPTLAAVADEPGADDDRESFAVDN
jgi:hypothetical protein